MDALASLGFAEDDPDRVRLRRHRRLATARPDGTITITRGCIDDPVVVNGPIDPVVKRPALPKADVNGRSTTTT
jgi:hypothetical protein